MVNKYLLENLMVLMTNVCIAGDVKAGDLGLGAVPGREAEFRQGLDLALKYAKALNCKR